jgi:hypothetical protein
VGQVAEDVVDDVCGAYVVVQHVDEWGVVAIDCAEGT